MDDLLFWAMVVACFLVAVGYFAEAFVLVRRWRRERRQWRY